jgi:maltooligosyltrehalose synthase
LPGGWERAQFVDLLTGGTIQPESGRLPLAAGLSTFPVAVLKTIDSE